LAHATTIALASNSNIRPYTLRIESWGRLGINWEFCVEVLASRGRYRIGDFSPTLQFSAPNTDLLVTFWKLGIGWKVLWLKGIGSFLAEV
jgi:hypothetical protein